MPAKKSAPKKVKKEEESENSRGASDVASSVPADVQNIESAESVDALKNEGREFIRSYSREVHGDDFLSLARSFQKKHPTVKIVDSESIEQVIVRYREKEDFEKPLKEQSPDSPQVDKERTFTDKDEALAFNAAKKGSVLVKK